MTDSGVLVVKADPTIRIRGNVDWMGTSTPIRTAAIDEAGALVVEFTDNHHDFYEATHVQTRAGVEVYDDQEGNESTSPASRRTCAAGFSRPRRR